MNKDFPTAAEILERMALALGIKLDSWGGESALAKALGVSTSGMGNWRRRNSVDYTVLIAACLRNGISLNFVLVNRGSITLNDDNDALFSLLNDWNLSDGVKTIPLTGVLIGFFHELREAIPDHEKITPVSPLGPGTIDTIVDTVEKELIAEDPTREERRKRKKESEGTLIKKTKPIKTF